jgi:hypothetical protein
VIPHSCPSRIELELAWGRRLKIAFDRRLQTLKQYEEAFQDYAANCDPSPEGLLSIQKAHCSESDATEEYLRVLTIFTDLVVRGIVPKEDPWSDLFSIRRGLPIPIRNQRVMGGSSSESVQHRHEDQRQTS